jgi:hypothetical protein
MKSYAFWYSSLSNMLSNCSTMLARSEIREGRESQEPHEISAMLTRRSTGFIGIFNRCCGTDHQPERQCRECWKCQRPNECRERSSTSIEQCKGTPDLNETEKDSRQREKHFVRSIPDFVGVRERDATMREKTSTGYVSRTLILFGIIE